MKRVLKDGLYRDERPEAGGFTFLLMYIMAFLIGAAVAMFGFLATITRTYHRANGLMNMDMGEAKSTLAAITLIGGVTGVLILFGWQRHSRQETRDSAPRPRKDPHKDFFDSMR